MHLALAEAQFQDSNLKSQQNIPSLLFKNHPNELDTNNAPLAEQHAVKVFERGADEQLVEREPPRRRGHRRPPPLPDERQLLATADQGEGVAETKARARD